MTILLYKDGKLIVDTEQPLEGVSLDNLAAILSGASDGDVIQYDATKGMWVNKSAPSSLPEVTASDKGKYLKANESTGDPEWASGGSSGGGVLVVDVTWNDEGTIATLDKTWNEINSAGFNVALESDSGFDNYYMCSSIYTNPGDGTKQIDYIGNGGGGALMTMTFTAATASDYPTYNAE